MSKEQARALLALIAELYIICNTPDDPGPMDSDPVVNGRVSEDVVVN